MVTWAAAACMARATVSLREFYEEEDRDFLLFAMAVTDRIGEEQERARKENG